MGVTIFKPAPKLAVSYNKPPSGSKSPNEQYYPTSYISKKDDVAWRSIPVPDKLGIVGFLLPEHFFHSGSQKAAFAQSVADFVEGLAGLQNYKTGNTGYVGPQKNKKWGDCSIPFGTRNSTVKIIVQKLTPKTNPHPAFRMALECNPRKLKPDGIEELILGIHQASSTPFNFGQYLADSKITRLDVAVDLVDVKPADLIVTAKQPGKVMGIWGADDRCETLQVHSKKKPGGKPTKKLTKPMGPLRVKIYDRNKERLAKGKPVPLPGHQVTRIEVVKRNYVIGMSLSSLSELKNPFKDIKISLAEDVSPWVPERAWKVYLAVRRIHGPEKAAALLGFDPAKTKKAEDAYEKHPGSLLPPSNWKGWQKGMELTGLSILQELAIEADGSDGH